MDSYLTIKIDEARAREILESASCCFSEGQGGDILFLLVPIRKAFPDLWEEYKWLDLFLGE